MARAHIRIVAQQPDGDAADGSAAPTATVYLLQGGTGGVSGSSVTGTPYPRPVYTARTGGSPAATSQTTGTGGQVEWWTDHPEPYDVGFEQSGQAARVFSYSDWELASTDVLTTPKTSEYPIAAYGFGDGTTTDQAAVAAAVAAASAAGGGKVIAPADSTIDLTGITLASGVSIHGAGPSTVFRLNTATNDAKAFTMTGTVGSGVDLASNAAEGAVAVTLTSGGGASFAAGDLVYLAQTLSTGGGDWPYYQLLRVRSVVSDTVTFWEPLADAYTTANGAELVKMTTPAENIGIYDCTIDGTLGSGTNAHGIWLVNAVRPVIQNVRLLGFNGSGLLLYRAYAPKVTNVWTEDSGSSGYSDAWIEYVTGGTVDGLTSHRASGFGPQFTHVVHSAIANLLSFGATNRAIKLSATSYCAFANVHAEGGLSTGLSVTIASHHNVFSNVVALKNATAGLWLGDGFSGAGALPSHHNVVKNFLGRFDGTQDVLLDSDSDDNVIDLAAVAVVTNTGDRNIVRPPTFGQEGRAVGTTSGPTTTSASYATLEEMTVTLTTTGGQLECVFEGTFLHSTPAASVFVCFRLDSGSNTAERQFHAVAAAHAQVRTTHHTFTGVSAGSHTVIVRWLTSAATATAVGVERSLRVREGVVA